MKRLLAALLAALFASAGEPARADGDLCHAYVVDVAKGRKALDEGPRDPERFKRALADSQVVFPEFRPLRAEEALTTKTYRFPHGGGLFITASVYYTDESMLSAAGADSMLLAVAVSGKQLDGALTAENNAVAELTSATADTARVKKWVRVGGRLYVVGLQCNSNQPPAEEP